MITPSKKGGGEEQMHLRRCSFRWPWESVEAIHAALPDASCPGIHRKPAPYRFGGRQGNSKQNIYVICTHFDGRFDGHRDAAVLYRVHRPMEEVCGFYKSH
jgi:hypothetical protein